MGGGGRLFEGGRLLQILNLRRGANSKRGAYLKLGANYYIFLCTIVIILAPLINNTYVHVHVYNQVLKKILIKIVLRSDSTPVMHPKKF